MERGRLLLFRRNLAGIVVRQSFNIITTGIGYTECHEFSLYFLFHLVPGPRSETGVCFVLYCACLAMAWVYSVSNRLQYSLHYAGHCCMEYIVHFSFSTYSFMDACKATAAQSSASKAVKKSAAPIQV